MTNGVFEIFLVYNENLGELHSAHSTLEDAEIAKSYAEKTHPGYTYWVAPAIPVDQVQISQVRYGYDYYHVEIDEHGLVVGTETTICDPYTEGHIHDEIEGAFPGGSYWCYLWAQDRGHAEYQAHLLRARYLMAQGV